MYAETSVSHFIEDYPSVLVTDYIVQLSCKVTCMMIKGFQQHYLMLINLNWIHKFYDFTYTGYLPSRFYSIDHNPDRE